ncbi:MAG: hypothetical protein V7723_17360 [Sneathiella sp.]|uniref:hypothetical protein n=1 Tax=Sneathiella sp. TaxID=1964365 RepID=UPI003003395C
MLNKQIQLIASNLQSNVQTIDTIIATSFKSNMETINRSIDTNFKILIEGLNQNVSNLNTSIASLQTTVAQSQKTFSDQFLSVEKNRNELATEIALQVQKQGYQEKELRELKDSLIRVEGILKNMEATRKAALVVGGEGWQAFSPMDSDISGLKEAMQDGINGAQNKLIFIGPFKAAE